jgi:hypothetical protein
MPAISGLSRALTEKQRTVHGVTHSPLALDMARGACDLLRYRTLVAIEEFPR